MELLLKKTNKNFAFVATKDNEELSIPICASEKLEEGNIGFRPTEILLHSLASCMSIDIMLILQKQKQMVEDYQVRISAERIDAVSSVFEEVTLGIEIQGEINEKKLRQATQLSKDKYCSVYHMLNDTIDLKINYSINNNAANGEL